MGRKTPANVQFIATAGYKKRCGFIFILRARRPPTISFPDFIFAFYIINAAVSSIADSGSQIDYVYPAYLTKYLCVLF
jgi:hypothetical protein